MVYIDSDAFFNRKDKSITELLTAWGSPNSTFTLFADAPYSPAMPNSGIFIVRQERDTCEGPNISRVPCVGSESDLLANIRSTHGTLTRCVWWGQESRWSGAVGDQAMVELAGRGAEHAGALRASCE